MVFVSAGCASFLKLIYHGASLVVHLLLLGKGLHDNSFMLYSLSATQLLPLGLIL